MKYGEDNFDVIEICKIENEKLDLLVEELNYLEMFYIDYYKTMKKDGGYNITAGGNQSSPSCYTPVDVYMDKTFELIGTYPSINNAIQKLGLSKNDQWNISNCCRGLTRVVYNYIFRYKGDPLDKYHIHPKHLEKTPIDVYDLCGNLLKQYDDVYDIPDIGHDTYLRGRVTTVCRGVEKCFNNKVYRYKGDSFDKYGIPKRNLPINCYDLNDKFVKMYNNTTDAAIICNSNKMISARKKISACTKGTRKTAYGFKWFYAHDPNQPDKSKIVA